MTDQTEGGNPGPMGGHGITVALIGAASAVMVGMINGKVWPFSGAEPVPVPTETPGPGPGPSPVGPQLQTSNAPPTPVQTARRFFDEVDPEFDAAVAVNRKIYVENRCTQNMSVRIVYEKLDKSVDGLGERYTVEPGKMILPQSDDGTGAATYRRYAFMQARSDDEAYRWTGKYPLTTEQGVMNFRAWKLEVDGDGDYRVTLDCQA